MTTETTATRTVDLVIANYGPCIRQRCLCCGGETHKSIWHVVIFDVDAGGQRQQPPSGVVCEHCLQGDVDKSLASPPYPAVARTSVPTYEDLMHARGALEGQDVA